MRSNRQSKTKTPPGREARFTQNLGTATKFGVLIYRILAPFLWVFAPLCKTSNYPDVM
jgi:hypothetical protein